jgi:DNA-binding response OmpR family regulator
MGFNVVVLESDFRIAQSLAAKLSTHFHPVHVTDSNDGLRACVARQRPEAIVLNLEQFHLSAVRDLHQDFPWLTIVCTHRLPDEKLWITALEAGASDVCRSEDLQDILSSVLRSLAMTQAAVA